jgi:hypothetical protein
MRAGQIRFVADGFQRFLRSPEYQQRHAAIEAEVRAKYSSRLSSASGFWERRRIKAQIRSEIRSELKKSVSPQIFWLVSGR